MICITNKNYGERLYFHAETENEAVAQLQDVVRACGPEFAKIVIKKEDYTVEPNYRISDRTGGGVTEDVYAETLDEAIERGREWIEEGDWERDAYETTLDCVVAEILRLDGNVYKGPSGVYQITDDECGLVTPDGDRIGSYEIDGGIGDDEIVLCGGYEHDCSGTCPVADPPSCIDDHEHDWRSPYSVVGGIKENPGCWSSKHGQIKYTEVCRRCGIYRHIDHGATDMSNGQCVTAITYSDPDESSLDYVAQEVQNDLS